MLAGMTRTPLLGSRNMLAELKMVVESKLGSSKTNWAVIVGRSGLATFRRAT